MTAQRTPTLNAPLETPETPRETRDVERHAAEEVRTLSTISESHG